MNIKRIGVFFSLSVLFAAGALCLSAPAALSQQIGGTWQQVSRHQGMARRQAASRGGGTAWRQGATPNARFLAASSSSSAWRNGLPPVRMDSFVKEAQGHAEHIYGDEGANGLPPYFGFTRPHRINTGITDDRDAGLTTGHGSYMPEAWGADEFIAPPGEWSNSGANYGDHNYNNAAAALDAAAAAAGTRARTGTGGSGTVSEADLAAHPSPGEGYQPMFQHGRFVGWWSPAEVALAQTDFKAALRSIIYSDRFWGDALSIEIEIGDRPMSDLYGALFP